jgi:hypothetical protein
MSSTAISTLNTDYLQIAFSSTSSYQGSGVANNGIGSYSNSLNGLATYTQGSDSGQLSPFAQLVSTLQQVQQQNPAEYQQLTQQIAVNLQSAAQTAQTQGNSPQANQLGQLATDFTNAAGTGQLPNLQDLAQAVGGAQDQTGTGSGFQAFSFNETITIASSSFSTSNYSPAATAANATSANATTANPTTSSSATSSTAANRSNSATGPFSELKQLLESLLASVTQGQGQSLNPLSIIQNVLSNAGINYSNG